MSEDILYELIDILYENKEQDYIFNLISNGIFKILKINRNYIFTNDILCDYVIKNINMIYTDEEDIDEEEIRDSLFDLVCDWDNSIFYPRYCAFLLDNGISINNIRAFLSKWDLSNMIVKIMMFIDKKIDIKLIYKNPSIWKYINNCFNRQVKPKLKYCAFLIEKCATFLIEKCATNLINEHETNLINEHETNEHEINKKFKTQLIPILIENEQYSIIKLLLDNGFVYMYHNDIVSQNYSIYIRNLKQYKFIIENNLINKKDLINIIRWNYLYCNMRPIEYSLAKHLIFKEHIDIIFQNRLIFKNCDYVNKNNIYKIKVLIKLQTNYLKQLYI
jgi:hypothetical protein